MSNDKTRFILSNQSYEFSKRLVQVIIPAVSALYFGLANIWGLPAAEQVVGSLAVLATFLGVILGISTKNYNDSDAPYDGQMVVTELEDGGKHFLLSLDGDPTELTDQDKVTFKVTVPPTPVEPVVKATKPKKKTTKKIEPKPDIL